MALGETIIKKLSKKFAPSSRVELKVGRNDLVIYTDEEGNAIQLFMGKMDAEGKVKGDRYARKLTYDKEGKLIKDHWDRKGRSS